MCFRPSTSKRPSSSRQRLCTPNCPKPWTLNTPKKPAHFKVKSVPRFFCFFLSLSGESRHQTRAPVPVLLQKDYKAEGKKQMTSSLYSQLPDTPETQLARELAVIQSEVATRSGNHIDFEGCLGCDRSELLVVFRTNTKRAANGRRASASTRSSRRPTTSFLPKAYQRSKARYSTFSFNSSLSNTFGNIASRVSEQIQGSGSKTSIRLSLLQTL